MPAIHPTAIISKEARMADDVAVGPYVVIEGAVTIAQGVRIIGQSHLTGHTTIGEGCEIHPYAAIGGPPQDHAYHGERTYCRIGARNVIREGVTIHRGTAAESATVIGDDGVLMAGAHVAHNCTVGNHVVLTNNVALAGHVQVGDGAILGGGVMVHQFVRIGEYVMVSGGAHLPQDAAPYMIHAGRQECVGINRIGLRRNGFSNEQISELRALHRQLFRQAGIMRHVAQDLRAGVRTEPGRRLLEFVLADSKRGIGGRLRRKDDGASEPSAH